MTTHLPPGCRLDITADRAAILFTPASPAATWLKARDAAVASGWQFHRGPDPVEDERLGRVLRYELVR